MNKPRGRRSRVVQATTEDGMVEYFSGQNTVKDSIWDRVHHRRFYTTEQAPIFKGALRGEFGYMVNTPATREVLKGT